MLRHYRFSSKAVLPVRVREMSEHLILELSGDEAVVLLDYLARTNKKPRRDVEDQAEQRVLWDLEASLERSVSEVLDPNYAQMVAGARDRVRDES
jgi:hypothetical protein